MDELTMIVRLCANLSAFTILISYKAGPGAKYKPLVSFASVLLAGLSLAMVFEVALPSPWVGELTGMLLSLAFLAALLRCRGNVAHIIRGCKHGSHQR
jgi:hypothetical protein